jgi:hypothetical protein
VFHVVLLLAVLGLNASGAAQARQTGVIEEWGGRGGQPPCPAVASGYYRPEASPSENLSLPGYEWWCEPGEAVIGYGLLAASHTNSRDHSHGQDTPSCPSGWQAENTLLAARALRAASAHFASIGSPRGLVLPMARDWLAPLVEREVPGREQAIIGGLTDDVSTCLILGIAVPEGRRITRIQTTLTTGPGRSFSAHCGLFRTTDTAPPAHGCAADAPTERGVGDADVMFEDYRIEEGTVTVTAKSWASRAAHTAYLRVYYR